MFTNDDLLKYLNQVREIEVRMIKTATEFKQYFKDEDSQRKLDEIRVDEEDHKDIIDSITDLIGKNDS